MREGESEEKQGGRGGGEEGEGERRVGRDGKELRKTLLELFASSLICRIHSTWHRVLPLCVRVCQGLDLIGKPRIGVCLCGQSWLPLRHESSWLRPTFTTATLHSV